MDVPLAVGSPHVLVLMFIHSTCSMFISSVKASQCSVYTVGELKDWTKRNLWSKTTLNTDGMGGVRVDPPTCKLGIFFLRSLTLTEPSLNNF